MKWLALRLGGSKWTVSVVGPHSKYLLSEDGKRRHASCVYETSTIYISRKLDDEARAEVLLHELMHALLHVSGADQAYELDEEIDERIVSAVTPLLHRLLIDLGFRFPRGLYS